MIAGQQIEAEQRDRIDQHLRELVEMIAARERRQSNRENRDGIQPSREIDIQRPSAFATSSVAGKVDMAQTLATMRRPNRPEGLTTSTPTMMTSATESLTSSPTT